MKEQLSIDEKLQLIKRNTEEIISEAELVKILKEKNLDLNSVIAVQKPYMERRSYATFKKLWPDKKLAVTSPQISFEEYYNDEIPLEKVINIMVGDLQRIKIYPEKGFQIFQEIPDEVWLAYEQLVGLGYDKHLVK